MSKTCKNCGAELPEGASFCPHCTAVQSEKQAVKPPRRWRKKALLGLIAALVLAAVLAVVFLVHRPQTYEGGAEVVYSDRDGTYHVLLSFSAGSGVVRRAEPEAADIMPAGMESALPSQLYVYREDTDEPVWEEFMEKVDSWQIEAIPAEGSRAVSPSHPVHQDNFPYAALASDVLYTAESGTNELLWTLRMKNGDTLLLRQTIQVTLQQAVSYYPETTPMDTSEELQALLAAIEAEVDRDAIVYLYLPPVTYEGSFTLGNHSFSIFGGSDGTHQTTFTGTLAISSGMSGMSEITNVCFEGSGGTGVNAYSGVILYGCSLTGWDIGAAAQDGAWVGAAGCRFEDNGVGLQFNTSRFSGSASFYADNTFARNETAVSILSLPGFEMLDFSGSVFLENGTDLNNPADHPVDLSGAVLE